jgi:hypothetical protein
VRRRSPSVKEKEMGDKPAWMRDLKPASSWWTQKSFEGQKEELADLDRYGIRPIVEALRATGQSLRTPSYSSPQTTVTCTVSTD